MPPKLFADECYWCGEQLPELVELSFCCDGHECGCRGGPIDPPFCTDCAATLMEVTAFPKERGDRPLTKEERQIVATLQKQ